MCKTFGKLVTPFINVLSRERNNAKQENCVNNSESFLSRELLTHMKAAPVDLLGCKVQNSLFHGRPVLIHIHTKGKCDRRNAIFISSEAQILSDWQQE